MLRISVVGIAGSGKSTLARSLAARLGVDVLELDSVYHQPGWTPLPADEFRARVGSWVDARPRGWVVDGNYSLVREQVWARADAVVWLDLPRSLVMRRVVTRTLRRVATREELWNGNREPWANLSSLDPARNIIVWSWQRHAVLRERYTRAAADPAWAHLHWYRLRSPPAVDELATRLGRAVAERG